MMRCGQCAGDDQQLAPGAKILEPFSLKCDQEREQSVL
jgi:hypothetical protein